MLTSTIRRARCSAGFFGAFWGEEFWARQETDIASARTAISRRVIRLLAVILLTGFIARLPRIPIGQGEHQSWHD
jgi:hypothetical protein